MEQSFGGAAARVSGVFAVVGLGLGAGALLFLWATDYFAAGGDDFGSAIIGGLALAAVMVFALLSGVIVAALGGMHAANVVRDRDGAITSGLLSGVFGHIIMIAVLGGVLAVGFEVLSSQKDEPATPAETARPVDPECAETFGADSPICRAGQETPAPVPESPNEGDGIDVDQLIKLGLGAVPAGVVGALTAGMLYSKKENDYE